MNAERRKRLQEAEAILVSVLNDEQDAFDNLPEAFQEGERGEAIQQAIDALEQAIESTQTAQE